jgi:hypothetical protein
MRRFAPLLVIAFAISCAHSSSGGNASDSGVRGTVMLGPLCPVEVAGPSATPCPDQPVNGFVTASDDGGEVARVHTDVIGRFEMPLDPGTYTLVAVLDDSGGAGPPTPVPQTVVVREGSFTDVSLEVDSGIR